MDALDRLFRRLVEKVRQERAGRAGEALTVAEIYQVLVPYRAVRAELELGALAEYEHALLRLLSGERGYAALERAQAREEIRRELLSPNPILGVYRDYAGEAVHLDPSRAPAAPPPASHDDTLPGLPPVAGLIATPVAVPSPEPVPPPQCRACRAPLPTGREVRFCPACGTRQVALPCRSCGDTVEPGWRFCASCGFAQEGAGAA